MSSRLLLNILKQSVLAPSGDTDAMLLRRFRNEKDQLAFAEVVRRYGRLVWSVARQMLPDEADAEDVFQATFLALVKASHTIRGPLAPWLHRVAFRIALKQRRTVSRRQHREQQAARSEAAQPIADSTWSELLSAVHEEISKLPENWRIPMVLCCLEGWPATQAAQSIGLKLGTFSSRLTLAKKRLLERLEKRGLAVTSAALTIVTVGNACTLAPKLVQKATQLVSPTQAIPANLLTLVSGVVTMKSALFKSAIALALFLGAAGGSWWMVAAQGVPGGGGIPSSGGPGQGPPGGAGGEARVNLNGELGLSSGGLPPDGLSGSGGGMQAANSRWKYDFYIINHPLSQSEVVSLLNKRESEGWDFVSVMQVKADAVGLGGAAGASIAGWRGAGDGAGGSEGGSTRLNTAYVFRRPNVAGLAGGSSMMGGLGTGSPGSMAMRGAPPGDAPSLGELHGMPGVPPGMAKTANTHSGSAPAAVENEAHQQLRGAWNILQNNTNNSSPIVSLDFGKDNLLTLNGRKMTYYINQTKSPAQLNIVGNGILWQCIYRIEDGRLTIAYFGRPEVDRPTSFAPQSNRSSSPLIEPTFMKATDPANRK